MFTLTSSYDQPTTSYFVLCTNDRPQSQSQSVLENKKMSKCLDYDDDVQMTNRNQE